MGGEQMGANRMIVLLIALSGALLGWMFFGLDPEFRHASGAGRFLDARLAGYDADAVLGLQAALLDPARQEARDLLRLMYLGPDLVLPLALSLSLVLLLKGLASGAILYGRRLELRHVRLLCLLPLTYGLLDYVENAGFLLFFPPASPGPVLSALLPDALPLISRLKLAFLAVSAILVIRLGWFRPTAPRR